MVFFKLLVINFGSPVCNLWKYVFADMVDAERDKQGGENINRIVEVSQGAPLCADGGANKEKPAQALLLQKIKASKNGRPVWPEKNRSFGESNREI